MSHLDKIICRLNGCLKLAAVYIIRLSINIVFFEMFLWWTIIGDRIKYKASYLCFMFSQSSCKWTPLEREKKMPITGVGRLPNSLLWELQLYCKFDKGVPKMVHTTAHSMDDQEERCLNLEQPNSCLSNVNNIVKE